MLKKEFFKGQRIRIIEPAWADHTDGFATGNTVTITEPDLHGLVEAVSATTGNTGILYPDEFEVIDAKEPTAPMTKSVLDLLRRKGAITSLEAQGVLRCRQLPARILELKRLGHKIVTELKFDPTGQKYARYHLQKPVAA
ncbi:helix-turn-helix domain-containing protein [Mesorhizobium sp. M0199]|uniref:helix-turn-helix domain-containing protein n=1 Tax=Mesorhizobium sp. M0199 TaxID=2956911 RepID=UPI0033370CB3